MHRWQTSAMLLQLTATWWWLPDDTDSSLTSTATQPQHMQLAHVVRRQSLYYIIATHSELCKVLFLVSSVCGFLFAYEIFPELLNGCGPNSHGRCVWSLARTSWKSRSKVRGQGRQRQKMHFSALSVACVRFMFGKTFLASSFYLIWTDVNDTLVVSI